MYLQQSKSLQGLASSDFPEQGLPPNSATGYEQLLERVVRPSPQVREQDDQLVQPDQPPSTKNIKYFRNQTDITVEPGQYYLDKDQYYKQ